MVKFHDFLEEHAKFPFPPLPQFDPSRTVSTTDVSQIEVASLQREWKAQRAVRDGQLFQKLCDTLENILDDAPLDAVAENYLLRSFLPLAQVDERGMTVAEWLDNPNESHASFSMSL
jgi:hypothetical protein